MLPIAEQASVTYDVLIVAVLERPAGTARLLRQLGVPDEKVLMLQPQAETHTTRRRRRKPPERRRRCASSSPSTTSGSSGTSSPRSRARGTGARHPSARRSEGQRRRHETIDNLVAGYPDRITFSYAPRRKEDFWQALAMRCASALTTGATSSAVRRARQLRARAARQAPAFARALVRLPLVGSVPDAAL